MKLGSAETSLPCGTDIKFQRFITTFTIDSGVVFKPWRLVLVQSRPPDDFHHSFTAAAAPVSALMLTVQNDSFEAAYVEI